MPAPKDPQKREEWKGRISESLEKLWDNPEYRQFIADSLPTDRKLSPEHIAKIVEANTGQKRSVEFGRAISERMLAKNKRYELAKAMGHEIWTEEEEKLLREMYPTHTQQQLQQIFPNRKPRSIGVKARRMGLQKVRALEPAQEYADGLPFDLFLPENGEKGCPTCNIIKPLEQFYKDPTLPDGYDYECRVCTSKRRRANYQKKKNANSQEQKPPQPTQSEQKIPVSRSKRLKAKVESKEDSLLKAPPGYRRCYGCKEIKPLDSFRSHRSRTTKTGILYKGQCKECREKNAREKYRIDTLRSYGLTPEEYDAMVTKQNGVCASCGNPETAKDPLGQIRPLSIDHCHKLGVVRGLLCSRCNTALGLLSEDPDRIMALFKYVYERCLW